MFLQSVEYVQPLSIRPPSVCHHVSRNARYGWPQCSRRFALLPALGLVLLVARYRQSTDSDRRQMRWPLATAAVVVLGLLVSGLLEDVIGPAGQAGVFVPAAAALPSSFLIGMLRHSEELERLAEVEASRSRLVEATVLERRRIERDLHEGAQQRLIGLLTQIELARERVETHDPATARELEHIREGLRAAHQELRDRLAAVGGRLEVISSSDGTQLRGLVPAVPRA